MSSLRSLSGELKPEWDSFRGVLTERELSSRAKMNILGSS